MMPHIGGDGGLALGDEQRVGPHRDLLDRERPELTAAIDANPVTIRGTSRNE